MKHTLAQNVGVDISKDFLDVATSPAGEAIRFANNAKGHRALIKRLAAFEVIRVVFEATGADHRRFERTLAEAGLPMVKVNPRQARCFAEASGQLAKTDRCDAAMLARMGAALELEPRPVVSQTTDELKELLGARDALIKDRVAALNWRKTALSALIKRQLAQRLRQIDAQIDAIDQQQKKLRSADSICPGAISNPPQHPGGRRRHRQCPDRRNARTRPTRAGSGRKPRRPRPNRQRQWKILRQALNPRRMIPSPPSPYHACPQRRAVLSSLQGQIRRYDQSRQA
jgi:hypothetical protein